MKGGTLSIIVIVLLVAIGGWYYYSSLRNSPSPVPSIIGSGTPEVSTALPGQESGTATSTAPEKDFTVKGYNFGFSPSALSVTKGDTVTIEFDNQGGVHDFVIDELGVRSPRIGTGATTSVQFNASLAGTFTYYSSAGNDRANGMWGTLTVTR